MVSAARRLPAVNNPQGRTVHRDLRVHGLTRWGILTFLRRLAVEAHHDAEPIASRTPPNHAVLEEVSVLDDFRFKKGIPSRASAVRELLKRACRRRIYERRVRLQIERIWRRRQDTGRTPLIGLMPRRGTGQH